MAEQLRVFVSHSHEDNDFCQAIVAALRDAGADVWYDEHNLGMGRLQDDILRELDTRPIFVVILSKHAINSKWVKRELDWAEELKERDPTRVILPVTAGQIERDDFGARNGWLAYYSYKRIEASGYKPYPADEAIHWLLRALALTPAGEAPISVAPRPAESSDDLLTRGKALNGQKKYAEAQPLFERATVLNPNSFSAWMNVGYTLRQRATWENSLSDGERAKAWQGALVAYERAIALDDKQANAWTGKGLALIGLKRYDHALDACTYGTELQGGKYAYAWNGKGNALKGLRRYQDALNAYDEAIKRLPTNPYFWGNKAWVLRKLGLDAEAEAAEQRARELSRRG